MTRRVGGGFGVADCPVGVAYWDALGLSAGNPCEPSARQTGHFAPSRISLSISRASDKVRDLLAALLTAPLFVISAFLLDIWRLLTRKQFAREISFYAIILAYIRYSVKIFV